MTSFEFQLYPVGPTVQGGMVIYPMSKAKEVLRFYREFARTCPDELTAWAALMTSPEGDPVVAILLNYIGDIAGGAGRTGPQIWVAGCGHCRANVLLRSQLHDRWRLPLW